MNVLIGVPSYNEAKYVGSVVLKSRKYGSVVVVDDGSKDDTASIASESGAAVISHAKNMGYGKSLADLFKYAKVGGFDVLVTLDGDGQHDPDEVPRFLDALKGADVVIGNRFIGRSNVPAYRRAGVEFISRFSDVADSQCGFRAYSKKAVALLADGLFERGMGVSVEILKTVQSANFKVVEVPCTVVYAGEGHSQNAVIHGVNLVLTFVWLSIWDKPSKSLLPAGFLCLAGAVFAGVQTLNLYVQSHYVVHTWALLSVGLMICTLMIFNMLVLVLCFKNRRTN